MAQFPNLAAPFAAVGLVGGWATADAFGLEQHELGVRILLMLVTPAVAGCLGHLLTRRARANASTPWIALVLGALVAGFVNGALIGLLLFPPLGAIFGMVISLVCAIPFIPALGLVTWAASRALPLREGTIPYAARARGMWAAVALATTTAAPLGLMLGTRVYCHALPFEGAITFAALGVLGAGVVLAGDVVSLFRLRRLGASRGVVRAGVVGPFADVPVVDFGVGDEVRVEVEPESHAYRSMERPLRRVVGDERAALSTVDVQLGLSAVALALACVGFSAALALWAPEVGPSPFLG
jgi:hypothetical protein